MTPHGPDEDSTRLLAHSLPTHEKPEETFLEEVLPLLELWRSRGLEGSFFSFPVQRGKDRLDLFWQGPQEAFTAAAAETRRWAAEKAVLPEPPALPAAFEPPPLFGQKSELRTTLAAIYGESCRKLGHIWRAAELPPSPALRLRSFLQLVITGLATVFPQRSSWIGYLAYYRDSVLRDLVLRRSLAHPKIEQLLQRYDDQAAAWRPKGLAQLQHLFTLATDENAAEADLEAFRKHLRHLATLAERETGKSDPYAASAIDGLLSRVFQHAASQAGLRQLDEGFALHLLLLALEASDEARTCSLLPPELSRNEIVLDHDPGTIDFERTYSWLALIAATGEQGRAWSASYAANVEPVSSKVKAGIQAIRRKNLEEGEKLLAQAEAELAVIAKGEHGENGSAQVVARFYHGAVAFLHYHRGDFASAWSSLDEATATVGAAIEKHRFLIAFSIVSLDIPLKKARLSRDSGQWDKMHQELAALYELLLDERPVLASEGFEVRLSDIMRAYEGVAEDEKTGPSLHYLRDPVFRQRHFLQLAGSVCHPFRHFLGELR